MCHQLNKAPFEFFATILYLQKSPVMLSRNDARTCEHAPEFMNYLYISILDGLEHSDYKMPQIVRLREDTRKLEVSRWWLTWIVGYESHLQRYCRALAHGMQAFGLI
jgi:hypothetical protein